MYSSWQRVYREVIKNCDHSYNYVLTELAMINGQQCQDMSYVKNAITKITHQCGSLLYKQMTMFLL